MKTRILLASSALALVLNAGAPMLIGHHVLAQSTQGAETTDEEREVLKRAAEEEAAKAAEAEAAKAAEAEAAKAAEAEAAKASKPAKKNGKQEAKPSELSDSETVKEAKAPPPPSLSPDAPVAKEVAAEPIEDQIEKAEDTATAVLPDDIKEADRAELKAAEAKRRKKVKNNREELIGAAAAGLAVGLLVPQLGGTVVDDEGDRFVVERNGQYFVRRDESALFRDDAEDVTYEQLRGGRTLETIYRRNGSRIETVRDAGGYILRRVKITPRGREVVLFDSRDIDDNRRINYEENLPPIQLTIPRDEYIVSGGRQTRRSLAEIFAAPTVEPLDQSFSLREVRENSRLREYVRRVDLDTITFDSGSFTVRQSQVAYLADIAGGMLDLIDENPAAVFLIEGHTDAVGDELYNLTLSDRRAETVARILAEAYGVPPENMVTEGYGEQFLKVPTQGDERANRRVTIRNISPLLKTARN